LSGISIATVWLSPDWRCILRKPAASQVCLLRLAPARQANLTLLDQGACNGHSYRGHRPGIISLFIMCIGIIRNNSLVGGRARAELNLRPLSASRSTAHGGRVR